MLLIWASLMFEIGMKCSSAIKDIRKNELERIYVLEVLLVKKLVFEYLIAISALTKKIVLVRCHALS